MAIRKSAAIETHELIDALTRADAVARETAAARLTAIGARVVPHLLAAFGTSSSPVARTLILKVLESLHDRRGLTLALGVLAEARGEPAVTTAAVSLLGVFLDEKNTQALEALGAVVADTSRPDLDRIAAWQMLERMPERVVAPLRKRLAKDKSTAIRRRVGAAGALAETSPLDPVESLELAAHGGPVDPAILTGLMEADTARIPLTVLHRLVEVARTRETGARAEADRREWQVARAAIHDVLARRGSRVALYDVRDTLASATGVLPGGFASAAALVGDGECLEAVADALARVSSPRDRHEREWRNRLIEAGRAIVSRERVTRRHAAARRLIRKHPGIAPVLFGC